MSASHAFVPMANSKKCAVCGSPLLAMIHAASSAAQLLATVQQEVRVLDRDELRELVAERDRLREQRDTLADAAMPLMEKNGHFYDCIPGKRGEAPGAGCSMVCQRLVAALRGAGRLP